MRLGRQIPRTAPPDPFHLRLYRLAEAYSVAGNTARAIRVLQRAFALPPFGDMPFGDTPLGKRYVTLLEEYRRAAARQPVERAEQARE